MQRLHDDLSARLYCTVGIQEEDEVAHMVSSLKAFTEALKGRKYPSLKIKYAEEEGYHTSSQPGAISKGLMYLFEKEGWKIEMTGYSKP